MGGNVLQELQKTDKAEENWLILFNILSKKKYI